jgi:hypothetical protein
VPKALHDILEDSLNTTSLALSLSCVFLKKERKGRSGGIFFFEKPA